MKQFTITIQDKEGLHARPVGLLSKAAKGFQCAVTLTKGEKTADLKKIFCSNGSGRQGRRQHHRYLRRRGRGGCSCCA